MSVARVAIYDDLTCR